MTYRDTVEKLRVRLYKEAHPELDRSLIFAIQALQGLEEAREKAIEPQSPTEEYSNGYTDCLIDIESKIEDLSI